MDNAAIVLLIEGKRASKKHSFAEPLGRRYSLLKVTTGQKALDILDMTPPDVIVLNAASMRTSGNRICNALRREAKELPIIHILPPRSGDKARNKVFSEADVVLHLPFTARKLYNRIQRFVAARGGEILTAGPFQINLESRVLTVHDGEEVRLTPKLALLLELFLRHPNEVLPRSYLMEKVWQTDYLGDTRTLDVHIRWLREALEEKPSRPTHLQTVRGKGYILALKA
ncbi:MAG: response regulator transcription factor [Chloroflexi bacterium]|nr:response regulator transcription factor [Chloroflexota bacterium]